MAPETTKSSPSPAYRFRLPSTLPPELLTDILTRNITTEPPVCALSLLCPEWNLCQRQRRHPALEAVLRTTRVDVYTLPASRPGEERGAVTTSFGHGAAEHDRHDDGGGAFCFPCLEDPRKKMSMTTGGGGGGGGNGGLCLPAYYRRELIKQWLGKSLVVISQDLDEHDAVGPLWRGMEKGEVERMVILREREAMGLVPFEDDDIVIAVKENKGEGGGGVKVKKRVLSVDGREKEKLPALTTTSMEGGAPSSGKGGGGGEYLFQLVRHLVVNTVPALAEVEAFDLGMSPSTWTAQAARNIVALTERLEYERRANLLLRWDALERLESLFLDLRGYSLLRARFLYDDDVARLAASLAGKGLALLVVAGLRSWYAYRGPDVLEIEEIEAGTWDGRREVFVDAGRGGCVNWWKMFKGAVRPGGRLVFVDKDARDGDELALLRPDSRQWVVPGY
ncbi:uncharacterized protein B0T15DRAFT_43704 [Chaetomium strumarium]|uniref:Uncharacterized protein n=1 Tax=Chaetomium strumarium TaxID=1170767 RepID=A0AAJ0H2I3_9PEZI|nr:hypothetical protein B0T15DRAFT_43704 [Chaetomium strumarium]